ncbi:MAG: DUF3794 domain-containing protein [Clostridia bacterium]|nr:DUF3794 domain-containing protein [Clostridia bacterium]
MSLSTQYSTGTLTRRIAEIGSQSIVEIRLSGQDIGEIVAVYPQVSMSSCEVSSGRLTYGGRLVCTIVYADESGKLCRIQKGAEFSHYADDDILAPAHRAICTLSCEKSQIKRDGSSYLLGVVVGAKTQIFAAAERNMLSSAEGAVCLMENAKLYTAVTFSGESEVEDDFDCNAEDVLIPAADVLVLDCNCRAGAVEISGEIYLSLLAVRSSQPVSLDRIIPFKAEIACEDALLNHNAVCRAEIKDISVTAKVNEEKGKCDVGVVAQLAFAGQYFEEEETPLVRDAFSCTNNLQLTFAEETAYPCTGVKVFSERVNGLCATKARLDYTCAFLAAAVPKAEFSRTVGGLEGSVTATLLYEQNGEIRSTEVNLPFSVTLGGVSEHCKDMTVAVCGLNLRLRAEGECEAEAVLKIAAADCEEQTIRYVTEAVEGEELGACDSALSVYIPTAGDNLWDTAKRLLQSPEEIEATNPELTFPLTGKERILIYRPKNS